MVRVKVGLETVGKEFAQQLQKKRIGLITNRTGISFDLGYTADYLLNKFGIKISALFSPEHGFHINEQAGESVPSYFDKELGVMVYSIYRQGKKEQRIPSTDGKMRSFDTKDTGKYIPEEIASELDAVIFDIQDVGTRVYTHVASMVNAMETCANRGIELTVLDRPNPINGASVEGPILDYPKYRSYIGAYAITMRHGMTLGELASMTNANLFENRVDLRISRMASWNRKMWFDETGWPWTLPSPNMPSIDTATVYPGQVMFEGTNVSEGRGTTKPFEIIGAPWIDGHKFAHEINDLNMPGVAVSEIRFTPTFSKFQGMKCQGIEVHIRDRNKFRPFIFSARLLDLLIHDYPEEFQFHNDYFDRVAGTSLIRNYLQNGEMEALEEKLKSDESLFIENREEFLIYR